MEAGLRLLECWATPCHGKLPGTCPSLLLLLLVLLLLLLLLQVSPCAFPPPARSFHRGPVGMGAGPASEHHGPAISKAPVTVAGKSCPDLQLRRLPSAALCCNTFNPVSLGGCRHVPHTDTTLAKSWHFRRCGWVSTA
jgi:hypothetical protein